MSILKSLYYGEVHPLENREYHNKEQLEIITQIEEKIDYFKKILSPDQFHYFLEYENLLTSLLNEDCFYSFLKGFKLGSK